jgi:signal transduction histidine kinase/ligand-binding sensor domain-containing protein
MALGLFAVTSASATAPWFVRTWQSDEGLPDNTVMGIDQTPDGFLWVATQTGVVRFDGVQFRNLPIHMPQKGAGAVHALCTDRLGRVWVAREHGVIVCMDQGRTTMVVPPSTTRADQRARMLVEDGEGAIWVSFIDGSLVRIKDGALRYYTEADGLSPGGIVELTVDQAGRVWYLRSHGLGLFRDNQFVSLMKTPAERLCAARAGGVWLCSPTNIMRFCEAEGIATNISFKTGVSKPGVTTLYEDQAGRGWIGTRLAGLFCFDGKSVEKVEIQQKSVFSIFEDRENKIWLGTRGGGLKLIKPRVAELLTTNTDIVFGGIQSICKDTKGQLWAVTWHKGTVLRNINNEWMPLPSLEGRKENTEAKCVAANSEGGVWIGTIFNGVICWKDGVVSNHLFVTNGLKGMVVSALRATDTGGLWIAGKITDKEAPYLQYWKAGEFRTFVMPPECGEVSAIEVDSAGDCWVATVRGSLLRVRGDLVTEETQELLPEPYPIRALLATPDNSLWIAFSGMGLGRLKEGEFTNFRMEQGLSDDYISHILSDGRGRLWLAGNRGIFSISEKNWDDLANGKGSQIQSVTYRQKDGLPGLQASHDSWPGAFRDADGHLHFAMQSGVAIVYPEELVASLLPPNVIIDRVFANGKAVALYGAVQPSSDARSPAPIELGQAGAHLHLPPRKRQVEFHFTAPGSSMPESIIFKYRLKGLDTEWIDAGNRRSVLYSQLAPGAYQFQVMACNRDGVWSEKSATLSLMIDPFWWETAWFRIGGPLVAFGLVGGFIVLWLRRRYQFRIERLELLRAMEKERARIAADLHDEIGANLTHISILSTLAAKPETEQNTSRQHNTEVTSVARQTIQAFDEILWSVNPKNDTLKSLSHFICRRTEEILAPAKVLYHFSLDETLPDSPVSPHRRHGLLLAVKEALHNILKHAKATRVEVSCVMENGQFVVCISDNGCGFDRDALPVSSKGRRSQGLDNMSKRLKELGGECCIERQAAGGTRVTFRLPLE